MKKCGYRNGVTVVRAVGEVVSLTNDGKNKISILLSAMRI